MLADISLFGPINSLKLRIFHTRLLFKKSMTMCARVLVFDDLQQFLLVKHARDGSWHFPGGGIEVGETIHEGAIRELVEETGIKANERPTLISAHLNLNHSTRDHIFLLEVSSWSREVNFFPNNEIEDIGFFHSSNLPPGTTPGTIARIREKAGTQELSDLW